MNPAALPASAAGSIVKMYSSGSVTVLPKLQPSSIRRGRAGGMPEEGGSKAGAACSQKRGAGGGEGDIINARLGFGVHAWNTMRQHAICEPSSPQHLAKQIQVVGSRLTYNLYKL
jgi:hypothetical protein